MLKFKAELAQGGGHLYVFAFSEANLNRLEFNREAIFFDFGYAGHPDLYGLIMYFGQFKDPAEVAENIDVIRQSCVQFVDFNSNITVDTLRLFALPRSILEEFRETPYWGYNMKFEIGHPKDEQIFFSGPTEDAIEGYLKDSGLDFGPRKPYPGFGNKA